MCIMLCVLLSIVAEGFSILCYNCSSTQRDLRAACEKTFLAVGPVSLNQMQLLNDMTVNCSEENSLCFVRSSRQRSRYSWIVQRGCYHPQSSEELIYLQSHHARSRRAVCERMRKADSEFSLCVCFSDHCNSSDRPRSAPLVILLGIITVANNALALCT